MLTRPTLLTAALFLLSVALPSVAAAAECAVLDPDRDSLSPEEQRAALSLLEGVLSAEGANVGPAPCEVPWSVSHVRLGESVTVRLSRGASSQQMTVTRIEELPVAYERLVRAIKTGQSVTATADRNSVTAEEEAPRRVQADPLVYLQLGGGVSGFERFTAGTAIGGGYRHSLDNIAIDIGLLHMIIPGDFEDEVQFPFTIVQLSVLYYLDGGAAQSMYVGGGIGYGVSTTASGADAGLQTQASLGYEFLRQSTIRLFPQLDLTLPLHTVEGEWVPSTALTLNVAFHTPQSRAPWWAR